MASTRLMSVVCSLMVLMPMAACQGADADADKAGSSVVVVRLGTVDPVDDNPQVVGPATFVAALEEVSGGGLRVEVDEQTFNEGEADDEAHLAEAIAAGDFDGGWPSTRAFASAGLPGLEAVEAPFTITSYDAQRELVTSPTAESLLERLDGTGLVGLAMTVGPLRRPFAAGAPLLGPADWAGVAFRSFNSPLQDATIAALGGEPRHVSTNWPGEIRAGRLRGLEFDVAQYWTNGMTTEAGHVTTDVVLWPKVFVLSVSQRFWDSLTDEQQGWVRTAAEAARRASVEAEYDESQIVRKLCITGAQFTSAGAPAVEALRAAVQPVVDELAADPLFAELRRIADAHPTDVLEVPADCAPRATVRTGDPGPEPAGPGVADGVYRVEITPDEVSASGFGQPAEGVSGIWTLTVQQGHYVLDCEPASPSSGVDCTYGEELPPGFDYNPREIGALSGSGDTVYFAHDPALEAQMTDCDPGQSETPESCGPPWRTRMHWSLDGDRLVFVDQVATEPGYFWVIEPWQKID
jgi:TRAP-type C4-dicarboxylate transport system substrate-binding protein